MSAVHETLPAIKCAPWCREGDGHTREWHLDDQVCFEHEVHIVRLTRMSLKSYKDDRWLDNLQLYLAKNGRESEAHIALNRDEGIGVELTLTEARELRDHLTALLTLAGEQVSA